MPISIRLLMARQPQFALSLRVRMGPPSRPGAAEGEREKLRRQLSTRLPPHLVRDVLTD